MQRDIREQLEVSTPTGVKLAFSLATGALVGSLSFLFKKKRLGSLVVGVAAGVSTFLLQK